MDCHWIKVTISKQTKEIIILEQTVEDSWQWSFSNRQTNECLHFTLTYGEKISYLKMIMIRILSIFFFWYYFFSCFWHLFCWQQGFIIQLTQFQLLLFSQYSESCQKNTESSKARQVSLVADEESLSLIDWAISSLHQLQNFSRVYYGEKLIECISTS